MLAKLEVGKATKELSKGQFKAIRESLARHANEDQNLDLVLSVK